LQHSKGAAIYEPILNAINDIGSDLHVFKKGVNEDHEEYSVMKNRESNMGLHAFIETHKIDGADFAGIADIYCVKDSIEDFHREFPNVNIGVFPDFVGNMDEKKFIDFLEKNEYIEIKRS
jgi:nicotinamidase/pyrazinamidase